MMAMRPTLVLLGTVLLLGDLLAILPCSASTSPNFYDVLGVKPSASQEEISRAFAAKSTGDRAALARNAYRVLSDPELRAMYDVAGEEGVNRALRHGVGNIPRSPDARVSTDISLEQAYKGASHTISIERMVVCSSCHGTGGEGGNTRRCSACHGTGKVERLQQLGIGFTVRMEVACDKCGGSGFTFKNKCSVCHGRKLVQQSKELKILVEPGVEDGHVVTFPHASEQIVGHMPGDVHVVVKIEKHPVFERQGNDLHATMKITLKQALLGFEKSIKQLDGRTVPVNKECVTQHNEVMRISGEGMPHFGRPSLHGDMVITFNVVYPSKLSAKKQDILREAFSTSQEKDSEENYRDEL